MPTGKRPHVVIVGAGFGGLSAAKALKNTNVDVTIIDRTNHHLFQPLLYQVATAALSPGDIAQPIRSILRHVNNIHVVMDNVRSIDLAERMVVCDDGTYGYDRLILAPGARHSYFGHDDWENHAPGLKDLSDALLIRERLLATFEEAESVVGTSMASTLLTFVVVGAGPTGVELAGAIAEIGARTMLPDFPRLRRGDVRVVLIEGGPRVLPTFDPVSSERALESLQRLGVEVLLDTIVTDVTEDGVMIGDIPIASRNVIWAAGNTASPLLKLLGTETDRQGRVVVDETCAIPGHADVYVIGDAGHFADADGAVLPGVAQVALQQGDYVAMRILGKGKAATHAFKYRDPGSMATIGRAKAVAEIGKRRLSGLVAWAMWAVIHIAFLIGFRNRVKVIVEWLWYYISFQPGARLIVQHDSAHKTRMWLDRQMKVDREEEVVHD